MVLLGYMFLLTLVSWFEVTVSLAVNMVAEHPIYFEFGISFDIVVAKYFLNA
jgi:hypothetical protein